MSENDNLQEADGNKEKLATETTKAPKTEHVESEQISEENEVIESTTVKEPLEVTEDETSVGTSETLENPEPAETSNEFEPENGEPKNSEGENREDKKVAETKKADAHVEEIDESNAEDAEDDENAERHNLESKDYSSMSMEQLTIEFENLLENNKIQNIKSQVDDLKSEFNSKFDALLDEKKEEFLSEGGNEIDFYYSSPVKKHFNSVFKTYRNNLGAYYKQRENNLKANLENRLQIIEQIKDLVNDEENINTTYKTFKDLQEQWRNAGPIPRDRYNNAWNSYHHQVEVFYDVLHLNRDLRDLDFKHNLDQKLKIIERAEELAADDNINRSFRELQVLHKMWKEELGPVGREHREEVWERFSNATKTIHDKRQAYYADLDKAREKNLEAKEAIISKIEAIANDDTSSHKAWQNKIKSIEGLREEFFNAGKVPQKSNEATWSKFKDAVRTFNRQKNSFYKSLKKDQYDNLEKKKALIQIAIDNKDNEDVAGTVSLMKKIQSDWKKIGHVPRKDSDKIWKQFRSACNAFFDRLHAERDEANKELMEAYEKKNILLKEVNALELSGDSKKDLVTIKERIAAWKAIGHVPSNKRYIDGKFNKALDVLFGKLDMDRAKLEMIKFENKLENLAQPGDTRLLDNEQNFIRKKITEIKGEIIQLENNMQFFSNVDESNPLVKDVIKNINNHKKGLTIWEDKLRKIKDMY
ncbi:DUF349 domain-containing protein [Psychroserpens sp. Hel_I_66]|uniref:DUF349 domain-containing protein n=1 Tax=Psychroserpens sp. Hel_I_66 TaxID=1250004 RepID=UPI000646DA25|nr:DUF349 domain-containing protein [Psychroserpens sp. Hel_I_66]